MDDIRFGKRQKNSLSRPLTASELAFAAAEPRDSTAPSAPAAPKAGLIRLLQSKFAAPLAGLPLRIRQVSRQVSWVYPRVAGLSAATVMAFALVTAIVLGRMPERQPAEAGSQASEVAAVDPVQAKQSGDSSAGVRFVEQPPETLASCDKSAWPYIDHRCFTPAKGDDGAKRNAKREAGKDTGRNGKIGPKPIDSRSQPKQDQNVPIGSLTAIAPASPTLSSTDGVGTAETDRADIVQPADTRRRAQKFSDAGNRAGYVKKKKVRQVADAGSKTGHRGASETETPFILPFSLFSQAR